ncbi:putative replicative DNA helicase [Pseudomonas phage PPpW-3]|uniref:Putative replicative DNA helicase n=1 Tax=Pseudomonas phage PPpW-3 TaxID=1279082 RepID=V5YUP8_9CAUD|nr:putative replicative DNA helicase [Pseudomonas phage PPpW-3]BAO20631.1 putative replicative DNA helicase [Pseudomonas phage PPpW-3]
MAIFKIEDAQREGARLVLGIGGISGSGKTYSALQVAWGLANYDSSKVGLLCTENRRGRLYADILVDAQGKVHKFKVGDLTPPFSPARYIEAIQLFVAAGVEVLVIDSVSHEWEGQGGCEDIAHSGSSRNPEWNKAKREHKSFMNAMLQSPVHVIPCMRAREKVTLEKDAQGKTQYVPQGVLPIQEKNFTFELTASLMMWGGGKSREILKCPAELESIFGTTGEWAEGYLTHEHGKMLRDWVDGGRQLDDGVQRARDSLQMACEAGMDALVAAWKALPAQMRKAISSDGKCPDDLKRSAEAFDAQRKSGGDAELDDLNAAVLGEHGQA